jgi:hypothetical protein
LYNYNLGRAYEQSEPARAVAQWRRYAALAEGVGVEKDRLKDARKRLAKLLESSGAEEAR